MIVPEVNIDSGASLVCDDAIHYFWGPTGPVMESFGNYNGTYAFTYNPQGDLVARADANSGTNLGYNYDKPRLYDAYGKELWTTEDALSYQPFRWKGQAGYISDLGTGLVYCWHRYYDPELGRWLTRDPIGLEGGVNTYAYCEGDPVNFVDPSGLVKIWLCWSKVLTLPFTKATANHAFLVVKDEDTGKMWIIEGGWPVPDTSRANELIGGITPIDPSWKDLQGKNTPGQEYNSRMSYVKKNGILIVDDDKPAQRWIDFYNRKKPDTTGMGYWPVNLMTKDWLVGRKLKDHRFGRNGNYGNSNSYISKVLENLGLKRKQPHWSLIGWGMDNFPK